MSVVFGIDPGIRGCGCSLFVNGQLVKAEYVANPLKRNQSVTEARAVAIEVSRWMFPHDGGQVFVECPMVYGAAFQKGNQNTSIIPLTLVVGAIAGLSLGKKLTQYAPREWKGTMDPDAAIDLIKARLSPDEHTRVSLPAPSLAHNVWDAVGIGLKAVGRFEPKRIFARES